jgi:hypothetical protein
MKNKNKNKTRTKKHIPYKTYSKVNQFKHRKYTLDNKSQPKYLRKLLSRISSDNSIQNKIVLRPKNGDKNAKIINYISGIENYLDMNFLKNKFKTLFTLDYMNYINLDIHKRRTEISKISLKYDKQPIVFEGYLAITITSGSLFNAYMLDTLKIIIPNQEILHKQRESYQNVLYFPQDLPDNFMSEPHTPFKILSKIYEIINQAYTIIKYLAIIIAHSQYPVGRGNVNTFEVIKVQMRAYDDMSLILDTCKIKKDWQDTHDEYKILDWLNNIFFYPILTNQTHTLQKINKIGQIHKTWQIKQEKKYSGFAGLAGVSLYKRDLSVRYKRDEIIPIYASNLTRRDFSNKFIIISSHFVCKDPNEIDTDFQEMIKCLTKYGLEFEEFYSTVGTKPAFIFFQYYEPINYNLITQHYNTPAYCSNMLDSLENIYNKGNLFFNFKKLYPNEYKTFIADSFLLTHDTKYIADKLYIARPLMEIDPKTGVKKNFAFSGKDIVYVTSQETLAAAKKLLNKYENILISDYIAHPLLFRGRKFHLRVYLIITFFNSVVKTHFFNDGFIWTAAKPFMLDKFDDMGIHDTHNTSTDGDYLFSSDFTTENMGRQITPEMKTKLLEDMQSIMDKIGQVLIDGDTRVKLYNNHKNGYQIEGIDIMVTDTLKPMLIECNSRPGFGNIVSKEGKEFGKKIIKFIDQVVFAPLFGS